MEFLNDFFIRALIAGIGVVLIAAPLGCVVVWRRMSYFGDTLAHSMILGVALSIALQLNLSLTVLIFSTFVAVLLTLFTQSLRFSSDGMLGLLSHATLALGLTLISFLPPMKVDILTLLTGGILTVSDNGLDAILAGAFIIPVILCFIWRSLVAYTISAEISNAEIGHAKIVNLIYVILLAWTVAISIQVVGILLITALLIIPALTARLISNSPEQMVFGAIGFGILAITIGLNLSMQINTPASPMIIVAATCFFALLSLVSFMRKLLLSYK